MIRRMHREDKAQEAFNCFICSISFKSKKDVDFLIFEDDKISGFSYMCPACTKIDDLEEIGTKLRKRSKKLKAEIKPLIKKADEVQAASEHIFDMLDEGNVEISDDGRY